MAKTLCYGCMEYYDDAQGECSCGFKMRKYRPGVNQLAPGYLLGERYRLGVCVGESSIANTYIGLDEKLGRKVAVKELFVSDYMSRRKGEADCTVSCPADEDVALFQLLQKRFKAEGSMMAKLAADPGVAEIIDMLSENGTDYILMSYATGDSLDKLLKDVGRLGWQRTVQRLLPLLHTVSAMHEAGFVHGNIHPGNIMLPKRFGICLLDYSAAQQIGETEDKFPAKYLQKGFAAPEQYTNDPVDVRTDLYSFCAVMYYCITGRIPVSSPGKDELPTARELVPQCPLELSNMLQKGMASYPANRFESARELEQALQHAAGAEAFAPIFDEVKEKKRLFSLRTKPMEYREFSEGALEIFIKERRVFRLFRKKVLLKDIRLSVIPGEMVMVLGGSGSGKTTFLNAVMGYEKAKGQVLLGTTNLYKEYDRVKKLIGYVPQQDLMREDDIVYNTLQNMAAMRMPAGSTPQEVSGRVTQVLQQLGIEDEQYSLVRKLSGGQRKRLSIALELVADPDLFFLDEPDSGLDGVMARNLMESLRTIADSGKIVMVITHTPDRTADLFDKVLVLAKDSGGTGRQAYFGTIDGAKDFFDTVSLEDIVRRVNGTHEGGEGRADEYAEKFRQLRGGK